MLLTLELNGQKRKLCFTKMAFANFLQEATKKDPLLNGQFNDLLKNASATVWAGMMTACLIENIEPDFTKEDVEKWMPFAEYTDTMEVLEIAGKVMNRDKAGEVEALTTPSLGTN